MQKILSIYNKINLSLPSNLPPLFSHQKCTVARGDSKASKHYPTPEDDEILEKLKPYFGSGVKLLNDTSLSTLHQGQLPILTKLSKEAKTVTVLLNLRRTLVFLG